MQLTLCALAGDACVLVPGDCSYTFQAENFMKHEVKRPEQANAR